MRVNMFYLCLSMYYLPTSIADNTQNAAETLDIKIPEPFFHANYSKVHEKLQNLRNKLNDKLRPIQDSLKDLNKKMQVFSAENKKTAKPNPQEKKKNSTSQGHSVLEINDRANLTDYLYQGDIILTEDQINAIAEEESVVQARRKRQAINLKSYPAKLWLTVFYSIDESSTPLARTVFLKAAQFWHDNTCVNFQENTKVVNRIRLMRGTGCYSWIGMLNKGVQDLSLGPGCETVGTAAHEIGHAMGFFHTQSRFDRDNSITVNINNVPRNFVDQFNKETTKTNYNYGLPYDYGSIMQYPGTTSSSNGRPTMISKDSKYQDTMGSEIVGFYDLAMMNELYSCKAKCGKKAISCKNGGFANPRKCSICICPSGYGGNQCTQRPNGCGKILTATADFQTLIDLNGTPGRETSIEYTTCNYWIKAPAGRKIEVRVKSFTGTTTNGCTSGGVEIKTQKDQKMTGYRICSKTATIFTSFSNLVPIITFNKFSLNTVQLVYRLVPKSTAGKHKRGR